jgi:hypothetical protein
MQLGHAVGQLVEALSYELEGHGVECLGISLGAKVTGALGRLPCHFHVLIV